MGTALAAIFATVTGPGAYATDDVVAALALSLVLVGYYRPPIATGWEAWRKSMALGGAIALLANLLLSYPVQEWYFHSGRPASCATAKEPLLCVAEEITVVTMPLVSIGFFIIGTLVGRALIARVTRRRG